MRATTVLTGRFLCRGKCVPLGERRSELSSADNKITIAFPDFVNSIATVEVVGPCRTPAVWGFTRELRHGFDEIRPDSKRSALHMKRSLMFSHVGTRGEPN